LGNNLVDVVLAQRLENALAFVSLSKSAIDVVLGKPNMHKISE
jgi:hypothetical protein